MLPRVCLARVPAPRPAVLRVGTQPGGPPERAKDKPDAGLFMPPPPLRRLLRPEMPYFSDKICNSLATRVDLRPEMCSWIQCKHTRGGGGGGMEEIYDVVKEDTKEKRMQRGGQHGGRWRTTGSSWDFSVVPGSVKKKTRKRTWVRDQILARAEESGSIQPRLSQQRESACLVLHRGPWKQMCVPLPVS